MRQLGPYVLLQRLGLSSSSEVYEAEHRESGARVVIKRALPHAWEDPEQRARFEREITLVMNQTHPALVRGVEVITGPSAAEERPGDACLVMHRVEGQSLRELLERHPEPLLSEAALADAALSLTEGLNVLHEAQAPCLVHGDLSAGNLLAREDGTMTLVDLGSAAPVGVVSGDGGTPRYAPPERQPGAPLSTAGDVYSLGVLLWELAAGRRWPTESPRQLPNSSPLSGTAMGELISRCVASDPTARPRDAAAIRAIAAARATPDGGNAWRRWLSAALSQPAERPAEVEREGRHAWFVLSAALGLALWTATWFIAQML